MTGACFVDTNIFVYARDSADRTKQEKAVAVIEQLWSNGSGRISVQVLNELYAVMTGKYQAEESLVEADLKALSSWQPLALDLPLIERAFLIRRHYRQNWWDCLIIAAAVAQQCRYILSEDLSDGANYLGAIVKDPFAPGFSLSD
jgi:predicted nucleic acid-binding protein